MGAVRWVSSGKHLPPPLRGRKKSVGYDIKQQLGAEGEEHRGFVHKIIKKNNPMLLRQIGLREEVEGLPPPLDL